MFRLSVVMTPPQRLFLTFSTILLLTLALFTGNGRATGPLDNQFVYGPHVVLSNRTPGSEMCQRLQKMFTPGDEEKDDSKTNKLEAVFDKCQEKEEPKVSLSQMALDPTNVLGPEHRQKALQEDFQVKALQNANPNDKLYDIKELLPVALSSGNPRNENVYHENLQLKREADHIGVYYGETNSTTKERCGLGIYFGTAFFHIYIGNWSQGFKHGFGINVKVCSGGFVSEGYEWKLGVPERKWILPSGMSKVVAAFDKCTFQGMQTMLEALKRCPRSKVIEKPDLNNKELLENNAVYRIEVEKYGRILEILDGKTIENASLIPNADLKSKTYRLFVAISMGDNKYQFLPAHNRCCKIALKGEVAGENVPLVQRQDAPEPMRIWKVVRNNHDSISIIHEQSGLYWEVSELGKFDVHLAPKSEDALQRFSFVKQETLVGREKSPMFLLKEGGKYMIKNIAFSSYLAREKGGGVAHTKIICENLSTHPLHNHMIWQATQAAISPKNIGSNSVWQFRAISTAKPLNVDIPGKSKKTNVQPIIWDAVADLNQRFELVPVEEQLNLFLIKGVDSGLCLQTNCSGLVTQQICDPKSDEQQYQFFEEPQMALLVDNTTYTIQARNAAGIITQKGDSIVLQKDNNAQPLNQRFVAKHYGEDQYIFNSKNDPNKSLGYDSRQGIMLLHTNTKDNKIKWSIERGSENFFRLHNDAANMYLSANISNGQLTLDKWSGKENQEFLCKEV